MLRILIHLCFLAVLSFNSLSQANDISEEVSLAKEQVRDCAVRNFAQYAVTQLFQRLDWSTDEVSIDKENIHSRSLLATPNHYMYIGASLSHSLLWQWLGDERDTIEGIEQINDREIIVQLEHDGKPYLASIRGTFRYNVDVPHEGMEGDQVKQAHVWSNVANITFADYAEINLYNAELRKIAWLSFGIDAFPAGCRKTVYAK